MTAQWICRLLALVCLGAGCGLAQTTIPDTPAGHTLQAWLDAFNSGDRARIELMIAKYKPPLALDATLSFRNQTGGFDLLSIEKSDPRHLEFRVKEKSTDG